MKILSDINLTKNKQLEVGSIQLDLSPSSILYKEGQIFWNNQKRQPAIQLYNQNVEINPGFEFFIPVINKTGTTMNNGTVVYPITTTNENGFVEFEIGLADCRYKERSQLVGVLTQQLVDGESGFAIKGGLISNFDTSQFNGSDLLYLFEEGQITDVRPVGGCYTIIIGAVGTIHATEGNFQVDIVGSELTSDMTNQNGFPKEERFKLDVLVDDLTRTITLNKINDYYFYQYGIKYQKTLNESLVFSDIEGLHAIYYDLGILKYLANPTELQFEDIVLNKTWVAAIYWDATNQESILILDERHGLMDPVTHLQQHQSRGTFYLNGMGLNIVNIDEASVIDNTTIEYELSPGRNKDEDIEHEVVEKTITDNIQEFYLLGTEPSLRINSLNPYGISSGANGRLNYNEFTGSTWQITEAIDKDYVFRHIYAVPKVNKSETSYISFMGTNKYLSIEEAESGIAADKSLLENYIIAPEYTHAYSILYRTRDNYSNTYKSKIVSLTNGAQAFDFRFEKSTNTSSSAATSHTVLTDRDSAGSHPAIAISYSNTATGMIALNVQEAIDEVYDIASNIDTSGFVTFTGAETISGTKTFTSRPIFNGGTSGALSPFTVDSNELVANLNADLLDSQEGSYYLNYNNFSNTPSLSLVNNGAGNAVTSITVDGHEITINKNNTFLTSYTETDPIFNASPAGSITNLDITDWDTAYSWGNHANAGYLTSFTESDPIFTASVAAGITNTNINNWDAAYGWGDHSLESYLTSETDPIFVASPAYGITSQKITNWDNAFNWGDHSLEGYLTSETDPIFTASAASNITLTNISNWDTAYGWGDHSVEGYLTSENYVDSVSFTSGILTLGRTGLLTDLSVNLDGRYLQSYSESDTLDSVTTRDNTTSNGILVGSVETTGNIVVGGSLFVSGTVTTINTEEVNLADNIIKINSNFTGTTPTENGGIEIERGTQINYQFLFDETNDDFRIGEIGELQPVLTRDEVVNLNNNEILVWDNTNYRAISKTLNELGIQPAGTYDNYVNWTASDGVNSSDINSGNTLTIVGSGASSVAYNSSTKTFTISSTDEDTVYEHPTYSSVNLDTNTAQVVDTIDVINGHINGITTRNLTLSDLGYTAPTIGNGTITISAGIDLTTGGDFSTNQGANETITINHSNTSRADTVSSLSPSHGGNFTAVDSVVTNARGHVTGINLKTITLPADENTHWTSKNVVNSLATATANGTATNGNVKLNHIENGEVRSSHNIIGGGATTVTSDASGNITITSTNNIDYINGASFNTSTGVLSLTGVGNAGATVDLDERYLQSYTETDTLDDVTTRGSETTNEVTASAYNMGSSTSTTVKATMQYNETTESIEFIFA